MPIHFPRQSPCNWVGDRLPLFADGELPWTDRREIERHLIVCGRCRSRESSQLGALEVLKTVAGIDPASLNGSDAPFTSLWPAVARQIQDAKHNPSPSAFSWEGATSRLADTWDGLAESLRGLGRFSAVSSLSQFRVVPVMMAALLLVSVTVLGVGSWVRWTENLSQSEIAAATRPILDPEPYGITRTRGPALPSDDSNLAKNEGSSAKPDRGGSSSRFSYDLDHGTLMGPNSLDLKPSY